MGNNKSIYSIVDSDEIVDKPTPKITPIYPKGLPYHISLNYKLKSTSYLEGAYFPIYDLRNGKMTWKLVVNVYGEELKFELYMLKGHNDEIIDSSQIIPLRYNSGSTNYMTKLKGHNDDKYVELYPDNIHCHILDNLKLKSKLIIYGFIKLDNQNKNPIAF